jgi:uncharacterized Fe-S cluster-containing protein
MNDIEKNSAAAAGLPGLDCGVCGSRTCAEFAGRVKEKPELKKRCIHLASEGTSSAKAAEKHAAHGCQAGDCAACGADHARGPAPAPAKPWTDSLGRDFDFYLEHFPEDPGPREIIIPHNPAITKELDLKPGDTIIGRPLGMSCGCPVTHCGAVLNADPRTGVVTWCVTGPLKPREGGCKDIGFYSAEAYEGLVRETRAELKIGMRYFFQPKMCMLQWRHSGLLNYVNRGPDGLQVRLEGLWIG